METPTTNKSTRPAWQNWQKIGLCASVVVLICFFMPWVEMGVSFLKTNMSGWQLATGSGPASVSAPAWPSLLLIPLSMLAVIVVVGAPLINQRLPFQVQGRQMSLLLIVAGALSLLLLGYQYYDLDAQFNRNWVGAFAQTLVKHVFGWTLSLLGSGVVLAAGVMELRANNSAQQQSVTSRPGSWMDQP